MYFHNYLSDSFGQKISTYSQLEEGVVILQSRPILMTSCYFAIIEYTVELTISVYYKLESMCTGIKKIQIDTQIRGVNQMGVAKKRLV